jgi:hypothetical protein
MKRFSTPPELFVCWDRKQKQFKVSAAGTVAVIAVCAGLLIAFCLFMALKFYH